jgi:hypothetical protein
VLALWLANLAPEFYQKYFASAHGPDFVNAFDNAYDASHRRLATKSSDGPHDESFKLSACNVWGHDVTYHFLANDVSCLSLPSVSPPV